MAQSVLSDTIKVAYADDNPNISITKNGGFETIDREDSELPDPNQEKEDYFRKNRSQILRLTLLTIFLTIAIIALFAVGYVVFS